MTKSKYFTIQLFLAIFGSTSAASLMPEMSLVDIGSTFATSLSAEKAMLDSGLFPNTARLSRRLNQRNLDGSCSPPVEEPEPDKCSAEYKEGLIADLDESIANLKLAEGEVDCDNVSGDEDKEAACADLDQAICDLENRKIAVTTDIDEACTEQQEGEVRLRAFSEAYTLARNQVALSDPGERPTCTTTALVQYQALKSQIYVLKNVIATLSLVASGLNILAKTVNSIPFFGDAASTPFQVAAIAVGMISQSIGIFIMSAEKSIADYQNDDSVCKSEMTNYYRAVTTSTYDFLDTTLDPKADSIQSTADSVETKVDKVQVTADSIVDQATALQSTANSIESKVDTIDSNVDDSKKFIEFLACQFTETVNFVRAGCDGIDNDCDSQILNDVKLVDECDEDQIPPTITLVRDPPDSFLSQNDAILWFMENTVGSDDCAPSSRLVKSIVDSSIEGQISIKVEDIRCASNPVKKNIFDGRSLVVDGTGQATTTKTFEFNVDGTAPTVTCGFNKAQDVNYSGGGDPLFIDRYNENTDLVNVQFFYTIEEIPATPDTDVEVTVTIASNEFEDNNGSRKMIQALKQQNAGGPPRPTPRVTALLAPYTCGDSRTSNICVREIGATARFYDITVVATDPSGNVGEATCTVVVVPEYDAGKSSKKESVKRLPKDTLIGQLTSSEQRYELAEINFVWNTSQDGSSVPPAAPLPPKNPKAVKRTKKGRRR